MTYDPMPHRQYTYTCRFDFEIGYLVESPCRCCDHNHELPRCANTCGLLDRVRDLLTDTVPCTRRN